MGVHPACFFVDGAGIIVSPARNHAGNYSSYLVHPTPHRAPTGERQAIMALLFCSGPGGPPWFKGGVEPGRAPAGEGRELLRPWELNSRPSSLRFENEARRSGRTGAPRRIEQGPCQTHVQRRPAPTSFVTLTLDSSRAASSLRPSSGMLAICTKVKGPGTRPGCSRTRSP